MTKTKSLFDKSILPNTFTSFDCCIKQYLILINTISFKVQWNRPRCSMAPMIRFFIWLDWVVWQELKTSTSSLELE
jgi:hypothetical protein